MESEAHNNHNPIISGYTFEQGKKSPKKALLLVAIIVLVLVVGTAGWAMMASNDNAAETAAKQTAGPVASITPKGINPASIKIKKGQEVTWVNQDSRSHRLSADQSTVLGFDTVDVLATGDSYTYSFEEVGTFHYYDPADPKAFTGTIVVE